jgi:hypothetical protein
VLGDPVEFFSRYVSSDFDPVTAELLKQVRPALRALLYLSRSDGNVHPKELEVMRSYVDQCSCGRSYSWATIQSFLDKQHPDKGLAKTTLKSLWSDEDGADLLRKAVQDLAAADGVVLPIESETVERIERLLVDPFAEQAIRGFSAGT